MLPQQLTPDLNKIIVSFLPDPKKNYVALIQERRKRKDEQVVDEAIGGGGHATAMKKERLLLLFEVLDATDAVACDQAFAALRKMNYDECTAFITYLYSARKFSRDVAGGNEDLSSLTLTSPIDCLPFYSQRMQELSIVMASEKSREEDEEKEKKEEEVIINSNSNSNSSGNNSSENNNSSDNNSGGSPSSPSDSLSQAFSSECLANIIVTLEVINTRCSELKVEKKKLSGETVSTFSMIRSIFRGGRNST